MLELLLALDDFDLRRVRLAPQPLACLIELGGAGQVPCSRRRSRSVSACSVRPTRLQLGQRRAGPLVLGSAAAPARARPRPARFAVAAAVLRRPGLQTSLIANRRPRPRIPSIGVWRRSSRAAIRAARLSNSACEVSIFAVSSAISRSQHAQLAAARDQVRRSMTRAKINDAVGARPARRPG